MRKFLILMVMLAAGLCAKNITDMCGRSVTLDENITRTIGSSPPMMAMLYALAPETLAGVTYKFFEYEKQYMRENVKKLPVTGGFFGGGAQASVEKVLSLKPQAVLVWDKAVSERFTTSLEKFGVPMICLKQDNMRQSIEAIELLGEALGVQERAGKLASYARAAMDRVGRSVAAYSGAKMRVFVADGADGQTSECDRADASVEIIALAGGINAHQCALDEGSQREKLSLERLYALDPDVIFVRERSAYDELIMPNSAWRGLKAHKNGRIHLIPSAPFAWLARPQAFTRFLGLMWMHHKLYPSHFEFDEIHETQRFYRDFVGVEMSDEMTKKLFKGDR
jgi:iron complex transport system substrate-binding protein